jgi:hypothetical protein
VVNPVPVIVVFDPFAAFLTLYPIPPIPPPPIVTV